MHISIAQSESAPPGQKVNESLDAEWEQAALEVANHLANPGGKRNRKRFGMARDLREGLTRFARIDSKEKLNAFQRVFPGFFPQVFWDSWTYTPDIPGSRPIPFWRVWRDLLRSAWGADFHPDYVTQLQAISLYDSTLCELPEFGKLRSIEIRPVHDFQRAIEAMGQSPWRAKFCSRCGQPFAADKPPRKSCFDACRKEVHRLALQVRLEKHGQKW